MNTASARANHAGNETSKVNIATGDTWTYGYDNANEITSEVETLDGVTEQSIDYKYDALGNRIEQDVTVSGTTTTTRYAYDDWSTDLDPFGNAPTYTGNSNSNVWADLDGSNNLLTDYMRGNAIDQLFARVDWSGGSGTPYWLLTDYQGSISAVVDDTGTLQDTISYDGWGNATQTSSSEGGTYLWTGATVR